MGGILSVEREIHLVSVSACVCARAWVRACRTVASPFIISLLLDLCLDLGSDLLQVHGRLGRLTFLLRHTLSTALFQMGKRGAVRRRWHHITTPRVLTGRLPSRCHARGSAEDRKRARRICLAVWSRLTDEPGSFGEPRTSTPGSLHHRDTIGAERLDFVKTLAQMFRLESREAHPSSCEQQTWSFFHASRVTFTSAGHLQPCGTPPRGQANTAAGLSAAQISF